MKTTAPTTKYISSLERFNPAVVNIGPFSNLLKEAGFGEQKFREALLHVLNGNLADGISMDLEDSCYEALDRMNEAAEISTRMEAETREEERVGVYADIPDILLNPPGLLHPLAEYIRLGMIREQPLFAVAGALQIISMAAFNYLQSASDGTLNLYTVAVGPTGCGKDAPRKDISYFANRLKLGQHVKESIASAPALLRTLSRYANEDGAAPHMLYLLDEYGMLMNFAKTAAGGHQAGLEAEIMRMYGQGRHINNGGAYADEKNNIDPIPGPYFGMYATTTASKLTEALTEGHIDSGALNRPLFVITPDKMPASRPFGQVSRNKADRKKMHDDLLSSLQSILNAGYAAAGMADFDFVQHSENPAEEGSQDGAGRQHSVKVSEDRMQAELRVFLSIDTTDRAMERIDRFVYEVDSRLPLDGRYADLWKRAAENMLRVAHIVALGDTDNPRNAVCDLPHVEWGIAWTVWCVRSQIRLVQDEVADTGHARNLQLVFRVIRDCRDAAGKGKDGQRYAKYLSEGFTPRSYLVNKLKRQMNSRDIKEALRMLLEAGNIEKDESDPDGPGRPVRMYRSVVDEI